MNIENELNNLVESIKNALELGYQNKLAIVSLHYDQIIKLREFGVPLTTIQKKIGDELLTINYLQNVVSKLSSKGAKRKTVNTEMHINREKISFVESPANSNKSTSMDEFMDEWKKYHTFNPTDDQAKNMIELSITPQDIQAANITEEFGLVKYISNKKTRQITRENK